HRRVARVAELLHGVLVELYPDAGDALLLELRLERGAHRRWQVQQRLGIAAGQRRERDVDLAEQLDGGRPRGGQALEPSRDAHDRIAIVLCEGERQVRLDAPVGDPRWELTAAETAGL